jgi:Family of unknown function (DUF6483)
MLRRDYILRMIEDFMHAIRRIQKYKNSRQWQETDAAIDEEFRNFLGEGAEKVAQLSETELLAKLVEGEPTQSIRDKTLLLVALLQEAGDSAALQERAYSSHTYYLKGLHLLLDVMAAGDVFEWPEFVPKVESLLVGLGGSLLPSRTQAMLMHHYERTGQFAKAEDTLFAILDAEPAHPKVLEFALAFYQRLQGQTNAALNAGNLPRQEVEAGLAEVKLRMQRAAGA